MSGLRLTRNVIRAAVTRHMSTEASLVAVSVDDRSGIATVTLQRPPVNSLSMELCKEIKSTFEGLEKNKARGIILTSAQSTVFSAGLDLLEMYNPDPSRLKDFWTSVQDVWMTIYSSKVPTAAAINGHCPAGGCLLACSCEYRVMVDQPDKKYTIGLNETQLGIIAPTWFVLTYLNILPRRVAERALIAGTLFPTKEALAVGLVDELATDKDDAVAKTEAWLQKASKLPVLARSMTKTNMRQEAVDWLKNNRESDIQLFVNIVTSPAVQKGLGLYLASLKKK